MQHMVKLPLMRRDAQMVPDTVDKEAATVDVIWTAGATVRRRGYFEEPNEWDEELVVTPATCRLGSLNAGAPFLDSHDTYSTDGIVGVVIPGTAKIEKGLGIATIKLSRAAGDADVVGKIMDGIIRNVSCGYKTYKVEEVERKNQVLLRRVVDWEPMEISAVALGADPDAKTRADDKRQLYECVVTRDEAPINGVRRLRMGMLQLQHGLSL